MFGGLREHNGPPSPLVMHLQQMITSGSLNFPFMCVYTCFIGFLWEPNDLMLAYIFQIPLIRFRNVLKAYESYRTFLTEVSNS
jgi:hypothetical protein